jgi:guanylate kinase
MFMVVSAPSGTGKTSICRELLRMCPRIRFSVSSTTRPPRPGERNGVDYDFISEAAFQEQIKAGSFVEWTQNFGNYYGTSKKAMQDMLGAGCDLLFDIEPTGARALKQHYPDGVFVFVLPPSLDELKSRLQKRGESQKDVARRLAKAEDEIKEMMWYDYIIVNDELRRAVDCLRSIYVAEKCRSKRSLGKAGPFP